MRALSRWLARLRRDERGATAVEFALVFGLLILLTLGSVEVGLMMWQWNSAEKATQAGARYAAVHDLVAPGLRDVGSEPTSGDYGDWCTDRETGAVNADCFFATVTCTAGSCSGGYGYDDAAFTAIFTTMRSLFPQIERANVEIQYGFSGLGFIGRPGGQPMMVTVRLRSMTYDFFLLDALAGLPDRLSMPPFTATLVGEDMSNSTL
jgi:Flp pilus assembly pilin Flp